MTLDAFQLEKVTTEELTVARIEIEKVVLGFVIDLADASDIRNLRENIKHARIKIAKNVVAIE